MGEFKSTKKKKRKEAQDSWKKFFFDARCFIVDGFVVDHNGKTLSKKDFEKMVKADAEKEMDRWRSR